MLTRFSVTNFQCIKDTATLDMRSITLSEYKDSLINKRLLPVAAIYGPNGGGKSTLLRALFTVNTLIARHFHTIGAMSFSDLAAIGLPVTPFKFDKECLTKPTEFELFIEIDNIEYKYYISIFNNKIVDESLFFKKITSENSEELFSRHDKEIFLGATLKKQIKLADNIAAGTPLLAWIGMVYRVEHIEKLKKWFRSVIAVDYNNAIQDELLLDNIFQLELRNDEKSKRVKQKMLELLADMDLNIFSYRAERIPINPTQFTIKISTQHKVNDKIFELNLQEESNGTRKVFSLLPLFVVALEEGRVIIIDEMDAKIHPQLLKYIINLFTNKENNPNGAQLIFTSHDLTTMTNEVFRRDEIWFMAMNEEENSSLYSLIDIRGEDGKIVRKDAVYNKQYIEGRYGADPYLKKIKHWEE